MKFRSLNNSDLKNLERFMKKISPSFLLTHASKRMKEQQDLSKYLTNKKYKMILALDKNKIVGYTAIIFQSKSKANLRGIGVLKEYRKRGLGKKLAQIAMKTIKRTKTKIVRVRTWENNLASQAIIKSLGFKKSKTIKNDRINGESTLWFRLNLK